MSDKKRTSIPTEDDIERAKALMAERDRGVSAVRKAVLSEFKLRLPLHDLYIFPTGTHTFHSVIFFNTDRDAEDAMENGGVGLLCEAIAVGLESQGRGSREKLEVLPEVDSDENVQRKFGGNYFYRLR